MTRASHRRIAALLFAATMRASVAASGMAASMQMDDSARFAKAWLDQLEWRAARAPNEAAWQGEAWYGGDYNKIWLRSEGDGYAGQVQDARAELLWDHVITRWWSVEAGARADFGVGSARSWAALGVRGLAPQGIDVEATVYAGSASRSAARLKVEYELLITQRLVLQPEIALNLYGKADPGRDRSSGLADFEAGLRLRYEVRREFAPYVGVVWERRRGAGADVAAADAPPADGFRIAAGVRVWL